MIGKGTGNLLLIFWGAFDIAVGFRRRGWNISGDLSLFVLLYNINFRNKLKFKVKKKIHWLYNEKVGQLRKSKSVLCWSIGIISLWLGRDGQWGGHCLLEHADAPHTGGGGGEDGGPGGGHRPAPGSTPGTEGLQVSHNIIYDHFYVLVNKCPSLTSQKTRQIWVIFFTFWSRVAVPPHFCRLRLQLMKQIKVYKQTIIFYKIIFLFGEVQI